MKCDEFDINLSENVRLLNEIKLGTQVYPKGHALNKEDIIIFKMHGIRRIMGALMDDSDISYQTALGIIAAKVCGENTAYAVDSGICRIISTVDGVFINNEDRIAKFNRLHPAVIINTVEPYSLVKSGEVIAGLEITLPVMSQDSVDEIIFKLSGNVELLKISEFIPLKTALLYAKQQDVSAETKHFTAVVKRLVKDFSPLQLDFANEYNADYNQNSVADALETSLKFGNQITFVLGASRSSCLQDVLPGAVNKLIDEIANPRIPQLGASDLVIAERRGQKIIVLPYDYDKTDTSLINRYIKQAIFSDKLNPFDFERHDNALMTSGLILDDSAKSSLIIAKHQGADAKQANIGAVVLAAGIGSRSGRNKLMIEVEDGVPLFMKAVNAVVGSEASPVFVVTGYHDSEMQEYLENVDVNILYNSAYRAGIKTSITLGLKSIPSFCEGALIIPADMPNLNSEDINRLISCFKRGQEKQLCMFSNKGIKANPIIWSNALFEKADIVPENADIRPIFMEHADYTTCLDVEDSSKLLDVNFPSDLEKAVKI